MHADVVAMHWKIKTLGRGGRLHPAPRPCAKRPCGRQCLSACSSGPESRECAPRVRLPSRHTRSRQVFRLLVPNGTDLRFEPTSRRSPDEFPFGRVAERSNAPVLKTGRGASLSWVRIPPLPPRYQPVRGRFAEPSDWWLHGKLQSAFLVAVMFALRCACIRATA